MNRRTIRNAAQIDDSLWWARDAIHRGLEGGKPVVLAVTRETRSVQQNSLMWKLLEQMEVVDWHGQKYNKDTWKAILMNGFGKEQMLVPAIGGGLMTVDQHSSKLTVAEMNEFLEYIYAFGTDHGVKWLAYEYE